MSKTFTLTVAEILDLARFAGLNVENNIDPDDAETEITIEPCPEQGQIDDDGKFIHYRLVAYLSEEPDEGSYGLGPEIEAPKDAS